MTTADKVRALIHESGQSQKAYAQSVGIHHITLCNCLKDDNLSMKSLKKIADKEGIPISSLLPDSTPKEEKAPAPLINGYIEYEGRIQAIRNIEDLERVWKQVSGKTNPISKSTNKKETPTIAKESSKKNLEKIAPSASDKAVLIAVAKADEKAKKKKPKTEEKEQGDRIYGIIGAVIGDIVGSRHEFVDGFPKYNAKLFGSANKFTDDSILTIAVADAILNNRPYEDTIWDWAHKYPYGGWGKRFRQWLKGSKDVRYNSIGNGSGMRVSPVGFRAESLEEALRMAKESALPTHGSVSGIKAAQSIAASIYLAREKKSKDEIKAYVEGQFGYNLSMTKEEIQSMVEGFSKGEGELAEKSVPVAIIAFLNGEDYEGVIRTAITYGGDSDTIACMAGGIAAAYYGVPMALAKDAVCYLSEDLLAIINEFDKTALESPHITPNDTTEWNKDCIIVYGKSTIEGISGEDGSYEVFRKRRNGGYPIRTIGVDFNETQKDVQGFVSYVEEHPEKTFLVKKIGLSDKSEIGADKIAPLFKPVVGKKNVFLPKEYISVLQG